MFYMHTYILSFQLQEFQLIFSIPIEYRLVSNMALKIYPKFFNFKQKSPKYVSRLAFFYKIIKYLYIYSLTFQLYLWLLLSFFMFSRRISFPNFTHFKIAQT